MKQKIFIKPYLPSMYSFVEKWLSRMALNGYSLVDMKGWKFVFINSKPQYREYCIYWGIGASKVLWTDFYVVKKLCASNRTKLSKELFGIFEVDTQKEQQVKQFKKLRKKQYFKHYCSMFLMFLVFAVILLMFSSQYGFLETIFVLAFPTVFILYSLVSLIVVCVEK